MSSSLKYRVIGLAVKLIKYTDVQLRDGKLPTYTGDTAPIIGVNQ